MKLEHQKKLITELSNLPICFNRESNKKKKKKRKSVEQMKMGESGLNEKQRFFFYSYYSQHNTETRPNNWCVELNFN